MSLDKPEQSRLLQAINYRDSLEMPPTGKLPDAEIDVIEKWIVAGAPGLYLLGDYEVATRLSYFLWGTTPDDALLDAIEQALLRSEAVLAETARS